MNPLPSTLHALPATLQEEGGSHLEEVNLKGRSHVDLKNHPSGIVPALQNVVSTVHFGCQLDLKLLALSARNAEFNPKRFAALVMRIREPKTTALIFSTGKMVCTGAKSEEQSKLAARKFSRIIQKIGFPIQFLDFKIQNVVASCDIKFPVRLESIQCLHQKFCSYEPEIFPGLIYRMRDSKIVLLIFVSGKIVITGSKSREETYKTFEQIYPVLSEFKKVSAIGKPIDIGTINVGTLDSSARFYKLKEELSNLYIYRKRSLMYRIQYSITEQVTIRVCW